MVCDTWRAATAAALCSMGVVLSAGACGGGAGGGATDGGAGGRGGGAGAAVTPSGGRTGAGGSVLADPPDPPDAQVGVSPPPPGLDAGISATDADPDGGPADAAVVDPASLIFGCADGTREGFVDTAANPDIAGCSGGWSVPGVLLENPGVGPGCPTVTTNDTVTPACNRQAGNSGANPTGSGCDVADLCAAGWHVCATSGDVASHSPSGCANATQPTDPPLFFIARQSGNGCGDCATGTSTDPACATAVCDTTCPQSATTANDLFGCGTPQTIGFFGISPGDGCGPLDTGSGDRCGAIVGGNWSCDDGATGDCEGYVVVHAGSDFGGALCCRD
jgi:hypothetical protein